jgi:hypothetical protein
LEEEKYFLRSIFYNIRRIGCGEKRYSGWLPELLMQAGVKKSTMDTRIVVDINTDPGSAIPPMPPRVLNIGLGYVETLIVLYQKPDGNFTFAVGPVYSYYEEPTEGLTRYTKNEWKMRFYNDPPSRPFWSSSFLLHENECMVNVYDPNSP